MKERLIEFLRSENKSAAQLAEEIGVQPSGISHILSGRNKPSLDFVIKMIEKYPFLSIEWLLFGKGGMFRDQADKDLFSLPSEDIKENITIAEHDNEVDGDEISGKKKSSNQKSEKDNKAVEKIVWFFSDGTFRQFTPGSEHDWSI
ncbi:MAG: helix-turn-helix transcriptional regulator [Bacteroidota bacterium]